MQDQEARLKYFRLGLGLGLGRHFGEITRRHGGLVVFKQPVFRRRVEGVRDRVVNLDVVFDLVDGPGCYGRSTAAHERQMCGRHSARQCQVGRKLGNEVMVEAKQGSLFAMAAEYEPFARAVVPIARYDVALVAHLQILRPHRHRDALDGGIARHVVHEERLAPIVDKLNKKVFWVAVGHLAEEPIWLLRFQQVVHEDNICRGRTVEQVALACIRLLDEQLGNGLDGIHLAIGLLLEARRREVRVPRRGQLLPERRRVFIDASPLIRCAFMRVPEVALLIWIDPEVDSANATESPPG